MTEQIALTYSVNQSCYHMETLSELLKTNREQIQSDYTPQYNLIGLFNSDEEAHKYADEFIPEAELRKRRDLWLVEK